MPTSSVSSASPKPSDRRRVHLTAQGKGGVGKSLAASLLVQYHQHIGRMVVAYDADPVNASLVSIAALGAKPVNLVPEDAIDVAAADQFVEQLLACNDDVVIDSGAASFLPLSHYLIENGIADLLYEADRELAVHILVTGGGSFLDCARGLDHFLLNFGETVKLIVWKNEFFGPVRFEDVAFEDTKVYRDAKSRICSTVTLKRQNPQSFGANLGTMLERKMTFEEALTGNQFNTVERKRLAMIQGEVFAQLARIIV